MSLCPDYADSEIEDAQDSTELIQAADAVVQDISKRMIADNCIAYKSLAK